MNPPARTSWLDNAGSVPAAGLFAHLGIDWGRILLALLLCIALGVAVALVIRARTTREASAAPRIRVIEHARLPPRTTLHLIEYDQRVVLLMSDPSGTRIVDAHDKPQSGP